MRRQGSARIQPLPFPGRKLAGLYSQNAQPRPHPLRTLTPNFRAQTRPTYPASINNLKLNEQELKQFKRHCYSQGLGQKDQLPQLKISQKQNFHFLFSAYVVIKMSFDFSLKQCDNINMLRYYLLLKVKDLYEKHSYLIHRSEFYKKTLSQLQHETNIFNTQKDNSMRIYYYIEKIIEAIYVAHNKQILILIDDFDQAYNHSILLSVRSKLQCTLSMIVNQISEFVSMFLKGIHKSNIVCKVICTGVKNVYSSYSGRATLKYEPIEAQYSLSSRFYGFSLQEIENEVLDRIFRSNQVKQGVMKNIAKYYQGYQFNQVFIFNPYTVMSYLKRILRLKRIQINHPIGPDLCYLRQQKVGKYLLQAYLGEWLEKGNQFAFKLLESLHDPDRRVDRQFQDQINRESDILLKETARQFTFQDMVNHLITTGYMTRRDKKIIISNQETLFSLSEILVTYFLAILKNNNSDLQVLRKSFDLRRWESFEQLLSKSLQYSLRFIISYKNEDLMVVFMIFEFSLCLGEKYEMLYEKTLRNIKPHIFFFPKQKGQPVVIHENDWVHYQDQRPGKVAIRKQQAIFRIFKNNYLSTYFGKLGRDYEKSVFILRGIVGYRKKGRQYTLQTLEQIFQPHQAKNLYNYSLLVSWYIGKQQLKQIESIKHLLYLLPIPTFKEVKDTIGFFQSIKKKSYQNILEYNLNILDSLKNKRSTRSQKGGKLDILYHKSYDTIVIFLKMWFWGFAKINQDREWGNLKLALKVYFNQQNKLFANYDITIEELINWAIEEITPFYLEQQQRQMRQEKLLGKRLDQEELFKKSTVDYNQIDEKYQRKMLEAPSTANWQQQFDG